MGSGWVATLGKPGGNLTGMQVLPLTAQTASARPPEDRSISIAEIRR